MPKKFAGENNKAVEARARKAAVKEAENARKQKAAEDKEWEDNDKQILKKQQRKDDQERKKQQLLEKKAEAKALLEQEMNAIKVAPKQPLAKITRAQIMAENERRESAIKSVNKPSTVVADAPLEENLNRLQVEEAVARNVDDAITVLNSKDQEIDKHPEKRLKAAFTAFEEATMPRIKQENPTLRLSQLKQILRKEWMKSPDNPLNQRLLK